MKSCAGRHHLDTNAGMGHSLVRLSNTRSGHEAHHRDHHLLLAPAMAAQVRAVMRAEGRTMSDLVREARRLYVGSSLSQSVRRAQAHEPGGAHARPRRCRLFGLLVISVLVAWRLLT